MATLARAVAPKTKPRSGGTDRGSVVLVYTGNDEDTLTTHRAQRLSRLFGLSGPRARIIANLAWEGF